MDNSFSARKAISVFLAMIIVISTFFVMPITSSAYSNKYKVTANGNFNILTVVLLLTSMKKVKLLRQ